MGALFLHLKPDEYLKKLYKTKKLVEKTSFSLQAETPGGPGVLAFFNRIDTAACLDNVRRYLE
ncbi:hypothetical protein CJZ71_12595 [Bacillus subtilis]|nr:hypothetical protein [Bacillus subtilis]ARW29708.1 hypothetical protein S101441_00089 [Bacillus subtilis subsp. subtilis]ASV02944.1 hypothetical protein CJZ71_12595 [Bacillus subtilis]AYK69011.1 hypothetical protein D9C09_03970 [Bacillus subtilis subsp. subtilis]AYK72723.1 hypothetical protein D9C12_01785 [Bacillus subtilis subsp. subtilis]AYK99680.1 hypothetical protein D9C08_03825 [Bacillus subtilis subsp. subtilis]